MRWCITKYRTKCKTGFCTLRGACPRQHWGLVDAPSPTTRPPT